MQLAERRLLDIKSVTEIAAPKVSGLNRQIYQRLKLALSLELRRQIFVAVCDDLPLRDRLAASLQAELNYPSLSSKKAAYTAKNAGKSDAPQLVTLRLNLRHPNPITQIAQWLAMHSQTHNTGPIPATVSMPAFQLLGVEHLTRQSPAVQWSFLSYLREIDRTLPALESNLLIWVTQPWLRSIQESATEFWNWRTGIFEFDGEPTPAPIADGQNDSRSQTHPPDDLSTSNNRATESPHRQTSTPSLSPHSPLTSFETETPHVADKVLANLKNGRAEFSYSLEGNDRSSATSITESASASAISTIKYPGTVHAAYATESDDDLGIAELEDESADRPHPQALATPQPLEEEEYGEEEAAEFWSRQAEELEDETLRDRQSHSSLPASEFRLSPRKASSIPDDRQTPHSNGHSAAVLSPKTDIAAYLPETEPLATSFARLEAESEAIAELVDLVKAGAKQEVSWGAPLLNSQSLQTLQQIEDLYQQSSSPAELAAAYQKLGDLWRDRVDRGDSSPQTLTIAIRAYEQILQVLDGVSAIEPDILNDLGNLYWMLSRHLPAANGKLPYLERGIKTYEAALTTLDPHIDPQSYAMIQNNLGAVYGDFARYQDAAENLQKSIAAYEEALQYRRVELANSGEASSMQYAATLNNLGTAYWNLAQHQHPVTYLKQSIAAYNEAICYYSPDRQPIEYATIENNLGTAYWNLAQYEQPDNYLLLAISAYQVALTYRSPEVLPAACAATQNNLGTAYWHLANHSKGQPKQRFEYLQQAIAAYETAIDLADRLANDSQPAKPLSFDIFSTHNNLGLAHFQIATDTLTAIDKASRSQHLENALHHHLQALHGWYKQPDFHSTALTFVVQTIRAFYNELGLQGQNLALSKVPGQLLPEILRLL